VRYTGYLMAYHLFEAELGDGTEVYSLMRESTLGAGDYLDRYYDSGGECAQSCQPDDAPSGQRTGEGRNE
jgi:hypothetical protein